MNTHQQIRAKLWCNVAASVAGIPTVSSKAIPSEWADRILKDFDKRFPEPQSPVDTDPEIVALREERDKLREERDSQKQWKEKQIELNRRWNDVIDFVLPHPSKQPGQHICSEALRLLRERDTLFQWKKEQLEMNRRWDAVDTFVRQHPDTLPGRYRFDEAIRLMRERDLYHSQLRAHGITPARLS